MKIKDINFFFKQNTKFKQIIRLLSINVIGIPLGIVTNIIITNYLGPQLFGDYKFIISVFNVAIIFLSFGIYYSGNRVVLLTEKRNKIKEIYGAMFIFTIILFIILSVCISLYAITDNNVEEKGLGKVLLYSLPLGFILLWGKLYEQLLPASNQINILSKVRLYPKVLNLIFALIIYIFFLNITINRLAVIICIFASSQLLTYLYCTHQIGYSYKNIKNNLKSILKENKKYGLNIYLGTLFSSGFASLTDILISQFSVDNTGVGYYALANTLSNPLLFIPGTISTVYYRSYNSQSKISNKLIITTFIVSCIAIVCLWLIVPIFVKYFYGADFAPVIKINIYVSIGVILYGFADFFNRFLCAKGAGKELRNASFIVGISIMLANLLLIPNFGVYGAAYAKIVAGIIFLLTELFYYNKISNRLINVQHNL